MNLEDTVDASSHRSTLSSVLHSQIFNGGQAIETSFARTEFSDILTTISVILTVALRLQRLRKRLICIAKSAISEMQLSGRQSPAGIMESSAAPAVVEPC